MVWAIDNDDFASECSAVPYPLLRAINAELKAASGGSTVPSKAPVTPKDGQETKPGQVPDTTSSEEMENDIHVNKAAGIKGFSFNLLVCVLTPVIFTFSILH